MNTLPKDPVMLLSFVNTQLRDHYPSLEEFAAIYQIDVAEVISTSTIRRPISLSDPSAPLLPAR